MKYKILENPNYEETYELIEEGLRKKATILLFACCRVSYEGRALSELDYGERIIMMKPDGCFLIHQDNKVDPVNWQPPKPRPRAYIKDEILFLESHRRSPPERLEVEVRKVHYANYNLIEDYEELERAGYEKDMGDMIWEKPHIIEEGFRPSVREYATEHGFIDILGKDSEGNLMILELKARKAGIAAVKQIRRYLSDFENRENKEIKGKTGEKQKIRGLLVAPSIGDDALELLEEEGIEFVAVEPPRELKKDKKVTLDAFG